MDKTYTFTNEAKTVFNYIKGNALKQWPSATITPMYFIYSVLSNKTCMAYVALSKIVVADNFNAIEESCVYEIGVAASGTQPTESKYDNVYDECLLECGDDGKTIDTCSFLISMISKDKDVSKFFSRFGVTASELSDVKNEIIESSPKTEIRKQKQIKPKQPDPIKKKAPAQKPPYDNTEVEKNLVNISKMASEGKLDEAIGNETVISKILTALLKRDRNNVMLVGESGSGKTCTVQHIANMISEGNVPKYFEKKCLMKMDFVSLLTGTGFRGGFEGKYQSIVDAASKSGKYIFFIDDIHSILSPNSKFSEVSTDSLLDEIMNNKNIMVIATTTHDGYSKYIMGNKTLNRRFEKIVLEEKRGKELFEIIKRVSVKYEKYHNVQYTTELIEKAIELSERFLGGANIYTVCDILDSSAANELIKYGTDDKLSKLKCELEAIETEIDNFKSSTDSYDVYDNLCRKKIEKQSEINRYEKESALNRKPIEVTMDSLFKTVSEKTNIPVGNIGTSERDRLKNMDSVIKTKVIGQDEAVDTICRSVRRQRVGIGNPDKPCTYLFVGKSGVGKTLLAKKLSEEVFGDEKSMVRLDMSEYADKMSVNKLHGCFTPDMGVLMSTGEYKPIKDVKVGDYVITPDGNIRKVTNVWPKKYDGLIDVYRIGNSNYNIECTPNHELLVCDGKYYKNGHINKRETYKPENAKYKHSSETIKGDISVYPKEINAEAKDIVYDLTKYIRSKRQHVYDEQNIWNRAQNTFLLKRYVVFNEDLARILGYYVSEGGSDKIHKRITFTFNYSEIEYANELCELVHRVFGDLHILVKQNKERSRCDVFISNRIISYFLSDLCGRMVYEKHIPCDIFNCPKSVQLNFIDTAFLGDGNKTALNATRYTSASKKLCEGIHCILRNNGLLSQLNKRMGLNRKKDGRSPVYYVYVTGNSVDKLNSILPSFRVKRENCGNRGIVRFGHIDERYYYNRIIEKKQTEYSGMVYDLTIDGDSAYIVNGMSVHNSSPGYIGYEEGGLLTEAIKKNNHCVLLLDEIEKANEEIFNMFLQVFDEGRLTDNKGVTVDFRNVIIIMTSNIGTKEASEFKGSIGFGNRDENVQSRDIIIKTIKKKLPPEFINRIDDIIFFNNLSEDNLREIIRIEIGKIKKRVNRLGFDLDETITDGKLIDNIFNEVRKQSEYGARPILREIQRQLEDKLTDFLLDNNVGKGYVFQYSDIY
jgi:ATP-dependent Clp protease ATP-binding subunit ClpA